MKQFYFLFLITIFGINQVVAEACPAFGGTISSGTKIVFYYDSGTSLCENRPASIVVDGTTTYNLTSSCYDTISVYDLASGPAITGDEFTVTSGFDTSCDFSGGTLPTEAFEFLNKEFKVFPNPLFSGNKLELAFGFKGDYKIEIYNITGKMILSAFSSNLTSKSIDVSGLLNGFYMLKVTGDKVSITRKLVISK